ncbi:MAG: hypothetical protein IJM30_09425 [Thermoguttaceae bacterium]|nr:hypothetical protein [Thermoguttaceae bacterium]
MLMALISAGILVVLIKAFTDEEVNLITAFIACFASQFVIALIAKMGLAQMESPALQLVAYLGISVIITGLVVNFLCSTSLKRVLLIVLTYFVVQVVLAVLLMGALKAVA